MRDSISDRVYKKRMFYKIRRKIQFLGLKVNPDIFISFRLLFCLILFILLFITLENGYIYVPLITIIIYYFIEYFFLDCFIKRRALKIEEDALMFFPLLLMSLKNSNNIKRAISLTVDLADNVISKEFKRVLNDVNIGKSLDEALMLMLERCPSESVRNILISIIEANRLGNNVSESITLQLNYLRENRNNKIIKQYKVVPLKVMSLFIVVTLLLFLVFILYRIF